MDVGYPMADRSLDVTEPRTRAVREERADTMAQVRHGDVAQGGYAERARCDAPRDRGRLIEVREDVVNITFGAIGYAPIRSPVDVVGRIPAATSPIGTIGAITR